MRARGGIGFLGGDEGGMGIGVILGMQVRENKAKEEFGGGGVAEFHSPSVHFIQAENWSSFSSASL